MKGTRKYERVIWEKGAVAGKGREREPVIIPFMTIFRPFLSRLDLAVKLSKF